ncbi:tetratricopeptide repeat protein [Lentilactobacillus parabuchneri]|uniref:tetratricopeptide repeat protein n=1 Tax=Lentilactobacillus parabuchneri TaxID=152331 RepID=UPI002307C67D|nr:tetratricopeptide repeat protein [Lentilactobacillus parabuchneri]MDB1104305.1 tetratricopeptide repeat protein [Lentilactobacillus parabuchneri]
MANNNSDKIKKLQEKNQENQRIYTKKREAEEAKAKAAIHELVKKVDQDPDNYHNYYDLATFLVEAKDYEQAEELLMKALGLFDQATQDVQDTLKFGLGNVYYAAAEYDKAIKIFQEIADKKLQGEAYIMLAQSYMAKGDNKRAMVFALSAQSSHHNDPDVNQMIGDNLFALGNFAQAGEFYDIVLKTQPDNGKANFNRGLVAMVNGEEFEPYFEKAKRADPDYFNRGQEKLKDIEKVIQLNKDKKND